MNCWLRRYFFAGALFFCAHFAAPFDLSVFYHARFAPQEPRFAEDWLSSVNLRFSGGTSSKISDDCGIISQNSELCRYRTHQCILDITQNFCNGVFMATSLPFDRVNVTCVNKRFTTFSNMNITGGWTMNYEGERLDFVDVTLETGLILPTAQVNGQAFGMPLRGALSLGIYDWLTIGLQADITNFFDNRNGRLWNTYWYIKADHFVRGFSLLFGASKSNQTQTPVPWICNGCIPCWSMDTFHFMASYDVASYEHPWAPHIDFFYNHILSGKNIIHNSIFGLGIGADF